MSNHTVDKAHSGALEYAHEALSVLVDEHMPQPLRSQSGEIPIN